MNFKPIILSKEASWKGRHCVIPLWYSRKRKAPEQGWCGGCQELGTERGGRWVAWRKLSEITEHPVMTVLMPSWILFCTYYCFQIIKYQFTVLFPKCMHRVYPQWSYILQTPLLLVVRHLSLPSWQSSRTGYSFHAGWWHIPPTLAPRKLGRRTPSRDQSGDYTVSSR